MREVIIMLAVMTSIFRQEMPHPPINIEFVYPPLDFRFVPPPGMRDVTAEQGQMFHQALEGRSGVRTMTILLSLQSNWSESLPAWRKMVIEAAPKSLLGMSNSSDLKAMLGFAPNLVIPAEQVGKWEDFQIGHFHFIVTNYEARQGQNTVSYSRAFSTMRKGQVLCFAFSSSSLDVLNTMVKAMDSVESAKHK